MASSDFSKSFAVLVITRDHAEFIEECLNSIVATFGSQASVFVVDTGSLDETTQRVELLSCSYVETDIELVQLPRGTTSLMALEHASSMINADYVMMISGDDFLGDGVNLATREFLRSLQVPTVMNFPLQVVSEGGSTIGETSSKWTGVPSLDRQKLLRGNPGTAPGSILPWREVQSLDQWPNNSRMLIEDYWLWWSLAAKVQYLNAERAFINYRRHESSVTGSSRNADFAYSIGYCVGLAQSNARTPIEWISTIFLLARWIRKVDLRDIASFLQGHRESRAEI